MSESENQKAIMRTFDALRHVEIMRNNRGRRGKVTYGLNNARFKTGTSDLIGWTRVEITPDMVGSTVAVFTALEVKADASAAWSTPQADFGYAVIDAGGKFGFVYGLDGAMDVITGKGK
jgi:hypothetical protein